MKHANTSNWYIYELKQIIMAIEKLDLDITAEVVGKSDILYKKDILNTVKALKRVVLMAESKKDWV